MVDFFLEAGFNLACGVVGVGVVSGVATLFITWGKKIGPHSSSELSTQRNRSRKNLNVSVFFRLCLILYDSVAYDLAKIRLSELDAETKE